MTLVTRPRCVRCSGPIGDAALLFGPGDVCERCLRAERARPAGAAREPYPWLSDADLEEVIDAMASTEPEPEGMVVTDLSAWESDQYEAWCVEQTRLHRDDAA